MARQDRTPGVGGQEAEREIVARNKAVEALVIGVFDAIVPPYAKARMAEERVYRVGLKPVDEYQEGDELGASTWNHDMTRDYDGGAYPDHPIIPHTHRIVDYARGSNFLHAEVTYNDDGTIHSTNYSFFDHRNGSYFSNQPKPPSHGVEAGVTFLRSIGVLPEDSTLGIDGERAGQTEAVTSRYEDVRSEDGQGEPLAPREQLAPDDVDGIRTARAGIRQSGQ
ncbi:MAG: hypothetical protein HY426_00595 [Candidatus Levybacteria bacterium]|nr:hypothetical protein [Candidatus Levybacteria bacterium]